MSIRDTHTVEAHTLRGSPARELASEVDTDDLRALQLPGKVSHDINGISATNTASNHAETTSVRSMRVGTNHQTTRECVVLKDNLVDDTRTRTPETETVLRTNDSLRNTYLRRNRGDITFAVAVAKKSYTSLLRFFARSRSFTPPI